MFRMWYKADAKHSKIENVGRSLWNVYFCTASGRNPLAQKAFLLPS